MGILEFWNTVHAGQLTEHLGDTSRSDYVDFLSGVGDFKGQLASANTVLDYGPGKANFLMSIPRSIRRCAIDISPVARQRLIVHGVEAYPPGGGSEEMIEGQIDLATCISVVQHCTEPTVRFILQDIANALRVGGHLYMNGIVEIKSATDDIESKMRHGRSGHALASVIAAARVFGLEHAGSAEYAVPEYPNDLRTWLLHLTKSE
jgi:SAM-dependent methyltransferase